MASLIRFPIIGGLIMSTALASTITPQRLSSNVAKLFPRFINKETTIPLHIHVMHSPVLDFAPWLELHHVVFVGEPNSRNVYAVDYSPINQSENILKLLLGHDVPAEIRVRKLQSDNIYDVEDVKRKWSCLNMMTDSPTSSTLEEIFKSDDELIETQKFIRRITKRWSTSMNLYTHNCQHFSWFVKDLLKGEEVCLL